MSTNSNEEERGLLPLPEGVTTASSVSRGSRASPTNSDASLPPAFGRETPRSERYTPRQSTGATVFKRDSSMTHNTPPPGSPRRGTRQQQGQSPVPPAPSSKSSWASSPGGFGASPTRTPRSSTNNKQEPLCLQWPVREEYSCCGLYRVRRVGMLYVLYEWEGSDGNVRRIYLGPYWHFLLMTLTLLVCIACFVYAKVVPTSWTAVRIVGIFLTVLSFLSLAFTALSDPGIFPRYFKRLEPNWTYSEYAHSFRPPGTIFCQETQILIEEYNHFCPWSGTAIGKGNEPFFQVFLSSLVASLVYDIVIIALALHYKKLS